MTTDPDRIAALSAQNAALRKALEATVSFVDDAAENGAVTLTEGGIIDKARAALSLPAPEPASDD